MNVFGVDAHHFMMGVVVTLLLEVVAMIVISAVLQWRIEKQWKELEEMEKREHDPDHH